MRTTLFSVSYAGLWGQDFLDLEGFLRKAGALEYDSVELMAKRPHLSVLDYSADEVKRLADAAAESGVEVATVAGYTDFTSGLQSAEVPFVEMQLLYVRKLAELAQGLGAKIIRVFTGYSTDDSAYSADWDKCVKALREASVIAADYGVNIGVQNHHDTGVATEAYVEFLNDVDHDNCKAMYDPWVPALLEEDMYECAKALAPRMVQSTYADYIKLARYAYLPGLVNYREQKGMIRAVPLGHGFLDLKKFTRGLKDGGFDGYLCYEMCSPLRGGGDEANLDHTAATSLAYLNELIAD